MYDAWETKRLAMWIVILKISEIILDLKRPTLDKDSDKMASNLFKWLRFFDPIAKRIKLNQSNRM